ncbi:MAG: glutaredoxin family protein [Nanoarchaeota archaeon]
MRMRLLLLGLLLLLWLAPVRAQDAQINMSEYDLDVNLFYSYTCAHCHEEIEYLDSIKDEYPQIEFNYFEVSKKEHTFERALLERFAEEYNSSTQGVPRTFIGEKVFIGFDPGEGEFVYSPPHKAHIGYRNQIQRAITELVTCKENSTSAGSGDVCPEGETHESFGGLSYLWPFLIILLYLPTYLLFRKTLQQDAQKRRYWISGLVTAVILSIFLFILAVPESLVASFAQKLPFPLFVVIVALADGFNPCAFTVLFILLSLLTYTKRKSDMALVGIIFIITSAVMYFLFIMIMMFVGSFFIERYGQLILRILGLVIFGAGVVNLKDYLFFGKGVSLSMSEKEKGKITRKARSIVKKLSDHSARTLAWGIGATILLAIGVNVVELGCTAILPVVYLSSLFNSYGPQVAAGHVAWTAVYGLIYVIPLFAILFNFIFTFKSDRITENQGRILKFVAGVFMLITGLIMLVNPSLLAFG